MKKETMICFLVISILFLSGCEQIGISQLSKDDIGKIAENVIVCTLPYIRHEAGCCLDANMNGICDKDEEEKVAAIEESEISKDNQIFIMALTSHDLNRCNSIESTKLKAECIYVIENNIQYAISGGKVTYGLETYKEPEEKGLTVKYETLSCNTVDDCIDYFKADGVTSKEIDLLQEEAEILCKDYCIIQYKEGVTGEDDISCFVECSSDSCSNMDYIACLSEGKCNHFKENKGKIIGKCGVECLSDNDCNSNEECNNYKCEGAKTSSRTPDSSIGLEQYPYPFIKDCEANSVIVVGDNAFPESVVGAIDIATSLQYVEINQGTSPSTIKKIDYPTSKLASEMSYPLTENVISIGTACNNKITAKILGIEGNCEGDFSEGEASIRLFESNGKFAMVISGYDGWAIRKATKLIAEYDSSGLSGINYIVD